MRSCVRIVAETLLAELPRDHRLVVATEKVYYFMRVGLWCALCVYVCCARVCDE